MKVDCQNTFFSYLTYTQKETITISFPFIYFIVVYISTVEKLHEKQKKNMLVECFFDFAMIGSE